MEQAPFYIGQKVVSLKDSRHASLRKGDVVTVAYQVWAPCCNNWKIGILEYPSRYDISLCGLCRGYVYHTGQFYLLATAKFFAPVEYTSCSKELVEQIVIGDQQEIKTRELVN